MSENAAKKYKKDKENEWILVREEGTAAPVSLDALNRIANRAFAITGKEGGEISLLVCNDRFISELNRRYRNRAEPTDVLSFSMREGEHISNLDPVLGDIIISTETAERQALDEGTGFKREFMLLFIHGLLHLLGYTHAGPEDEERMMSLTSKILSGVMENT